MSKELVAKSTKEGVLKKYVDQSKQFGGRDVDTKKARIIGNNGYVLNQSFELTGVIDTVPVTDADGKQTEVFIGLETTNGQWLSLKSLMGLSSLRGYVLDGTMTDSQKVEHTAKVADDVTDQFIGWADCPTRDLYDLTAEIEANPNLVKGKTVTYKGQIYRPFVAKKAGKDLATGLPVKKGDNRAQDAKLWEVA
jgi:hypothetical protein